MNKIKYALSKINLNLEEEKISKLYRFYELVVEYNKSVNLTSITDYDEFILKHYVDSLYLILLYNDIRKDKYIMDLGTGGGFPGIPLAIACPDSQFLLVDSLNKRIHFLSEAVADLSLKNVSALHGRAEELGHDPAFREQFDICTSRAVANLSTLSEYALPFVKTGGIFVSYKSDDIDDEIKNAEHAINTLGGKIISNEKYIISVDDHKSVLHRSMIFIKKTDVTLKKYPRRAGIPSKKPLK